MATKKFGSRKKCILNRVLEQIGLKFMSILF